MTSPTRRARAAPQPFRQESAAGRQAPTQGHTGGDVGTGPHGGYTGRANGGIGLQLREIAALHATLARAYENLAEEFGIVLADLPRQSVHAARMSPPPTTAHARSAKALLKPQEAADFLDYHPRTLRRLEVKGVLPAAVGKGRLKRWRRSDLEQWDAEGRPGA